MFTTAYVVIPCAFLFTYTATLFFFFSFLCVSVGFYRFTSLGSLTTCFIAISNPLSPPLPPKKKELSFFFFCICTCAGAAAADCHFEPFFPCNLPCRAKRQRLCSFFFFVCLFLRNA